MKKLLVLVVAFVVANLSFAQDKIAESKIEIGPAYKVVDAKFKEYFTFEDKIVSVKTNSKGKGYWYTIQVFDKETLLLEKATDYKDFDVEAREEGIIQLKDKLFLFFSIYDDKREVEQLYVREINTKTGQFIDKGRKLFEVDYKLTGILQGLFYWSLDTHYKFKFETSFDETKLMVRYRKKPENKKDTESTDIIGYKLLDSELNVIVGNDKVTMPYTERKMDNISYAINQKGDLYIAARVYRDDTTKKVVKKEVNGEKTRVINYDIEILKVDAKTGELSQNVLSLDEGKNITTLRMFEVEDGSLVCAGYYSTGGSKGKRFDEINGVFKFNMDTEIATAQVDYFDIPLDVINENRKKRKVNKNKKKEQKGDVAFADLEPDTYFIAHDGSLLLIGEQFYTTTVTYSNGNGGFYTRTIYHYDDVLVTKINPDGTLGWMTKVAKRQTNNVGSFRFIEGHDNVYIVYVDHIENLDLPSDKVAAPNGKHLTAVKIDFNTGEKRKISLFDIGRVKKQKIYQFKLSRIIQLGLDQFVLEMYKKKKEDILIKVDLK